MSAGRCRSLEAQLRNVDNVTRFNQLPATEDTTLVDTYTSDPVGSRVNEKSSFQFPGKATTTLARHGRSHIYIEFTVRHRYLCVLGRDFNRDADTVDHCRSARASRGKQSTSPVTATHRHCERPPIRRGTTIPLRSHSRIQTRAKPSSRALQRRCDAFILPFHPIHRKRRKKKKRKRKGEKKMVLSCFSLLSALGYRHSLSRVYHYRSLIKTR